MTTQRITFTILLLWSITQSFDVHAAKLLGGDVTTANPTTSFSFDLLAQKGFDSVSEIFYVAAAADTPGADDNVDKFSIAGVPSGGTAFTAAAPATATVNGVAGAANPLYGQGISFLGMANNTPAVVKLGEPTNVYWITSALGASTQTILKTTDVKDATPNTTAQVEHVTGVGNNTVVAAVSPNGGAFGATSSGIAVLLKNAAGTALEQVAAVNENDTVKAVPIDLTTATGVLAIANDVVVGPTVDMYWDVPLQRLYVALQVTGAGADGDGARSIMVGHFEANKLIFNKIAADAAFEAGLGTQVVGAKRNGPGDGVDVQAHKVRVLHSSQGPSYLIVLGHAGGENQQTTVNCLALVDKSKDPDFATTWRTDTTHGTLASKIDETTSYFVNTIMGKPKVFSGKTFTTAATEGTLLNTAVAADALRVNVGGGLIPNLGNIQDVQVYKDTVFVHAAKDATEEAGIFYSQALFDQSGVIKGWTAWQRVIHPKNGDVGLHAFAYAPILGNFFTIGGVTATDYDIVNLTQWGSSDNDDLLGGTAADASVGLISQLNSEFSDNGGIFGLFDFPNGTATSAFVTTDGSKTAMMVATGYKKVVMALTMSNTGATYVPFTGDFSNDKKTYTGGSITAGELDGTDTVMISLSGGSLDALEAITCAEIVVENDGGDDDGTYFVVGGTKGLAVLRQATNFYSWPDTGLTSFFQNIDGELNTFVELGNYTNVRKLWGDGANLYVMTDKQLDRIPVNTLDETITATPIATLATLGLSDDDSFSDCAISGKCGVIGTNKGLFRVANGSDITGTPTWTKFNFPGTDDRTIKQIYVISPTALKEAFATTGSGGQLYVLESSLGLEQSHIHIFDVANVAAGNIDNATFELVSNVFVQDISDTSVTSPYFSAGYSWNHFTTDGAFLTSAEPAKNGVAAKFTRVPLLVQGGSIFNKSGEKPIDFGVSNAGIIRGMIRNSSLGSWMVYGDFGVRVHE
ncbi:hypothetical protein K9K77_00765 [Candidatus Babeliales bacterium]|nr:hypothetical protein [Candidatus Babeliales bacterium]